MVIAAISNRPSVLAILEETTEGVPVSPSAAGDYTALQDDFAMDLAREILENPELLNSLAPAAPIPGLENPTATFSHLVRHSGVAATSPTYNLLAKALFGSETIKATERDTVAGSTTVAINVDVGEGAEYVEGSGVLVKDLVNGYSIRPIESIAGDVLTPAFPLPGAPASGVNLGRYILYAPVTEGHPTLTIWHFVGNGGLIQMASGCRPTSWSVGISAGQIINSSWTVEGIEGYFNPVEIEAGVNDAVDFDDGGGEENATVAAGVYKTPHDLATAIANAMNALTGDTITVTYSNTTGKYTIATDGGTLSLLWDTGANTATRIAETIGFDGSADDTGATSYTADNEMDWSSPQTPSFDTASPLVAKKNELFVEEEAVAEALTTVPACYEASEGSLDIAQPVVQILSVCAETGKAGSLPNERTTELTLTALVQKHDVSKFEAYDKNTTVRVLWNFGEKDGAGNWIEGKCGYFYIRKAKISAHVIGQTDQLATMEITVSAFADPDTTSKEVYFGLL